MWTRTMVVPNLLLSVFCSATLLGQQKSAASFRNGVQEFPAILQQSVSAGKTAVGTKIQAKLAVATLVTPVQNLERRGPVP